MRQSTEFRDDLARRTCPHVNLDEFTEIRKLLLSSRLESLPHFRSMLPVVPKNWAGVAQFVGSRDNQSGFRFPAQAVDVGRLPRLPSCFFSLSISKLSLQPFAMSPTSFLKWSASLGRTSVERRPGHQSAAQILRSNRTPSRGRASRKLASQWQQRNRATGVSALTEVGDCLSF